MFICFHSKGNIVIYVFVPVVSIGFAPSNTMSDVRDKMLIIL